MRVDSFFDTNILIYAIAQQDPRSSRAESLLASGGGRISVQTLNEFVSVARRKIGMPWRDVVEALDAVLVLCPSPIPLTLETHRSAVNIAEKYGYSIYDSLVVATAMDAKCTTLYSEDFQDGQVIEGRVTIRNPFL
jgi:predicted nucleic acid-binding protein